MLALSGHGWDGGRRVGRCAGPIPGLQAERREVFHYPLAMMTLIVFVSPFASNHPIKGNFKTYSGERCIYHSPVSVPDGN
jgi:hypothetical protein